MGQRGFAAQQDKVAWIRNWERIWRVSCGLFEGGRLSVRGRGLEGSCGRTRTCPSASGYILPLHIYP